MAKKTDKAPQPDYDEIDLRIIQLRFDNPRITIREIADNVGLGKTAVWQRLRKIGDSDFVVAARNELVNVLPIAIHVYVRALLDPKKRVEVARDLLYGLLVLSRSKDFGGNDDPGGSGNQRFRSRQDVEKFLSELPSANLEELSRAGNKGTDQPRGDEPSGDAAVRA